MRIESDEYGNPTGEVRPMIDREPPNAAETRGASVRTRFCETSGAGSGPRSLAHRSGTAHCRVSEARNWGISAQGMMGAMAPPCDELRMKRMPRPSQAENLAPSRASGPRQHGGSHQAVGHWRNMR